MSLNAITQSDDIAKKLRNILIVGAFVFAIIFKDELFALLSSLLFRVALMAVAALACFLIYKCESGVEIGLGKSTVYGRYLSYGHKPDSVSLLFSTAVIFNS